MRGDDMKLLLNGTDITKRSGNFTRSDNVDGLAMSFSFETAFNEKDKYMPKMPIAPGDKVIFLNDAGKAVFSGMIVDENYYGEYIHTYTAYDYGWHLNKNEVIVQFRELSADAAIQKLCGDFGIPVGKIAPMPTKISKIYNGDVLSDCIKDIIKQAEADLAKSFRMEVRENKLYIEPYSDLIIKASFKPAGNLAAFDPTKVPADEQGHRSIADMVNSVKIVSADEKTAKIIAEAKDAAGIAKYGILQKVQRETDKNSAQAGNIAKNLLLELNKVAAGKSVTLLGDDNVRSGRILSYQGAACLVKSCSHKYDGATHTMQLELEAVK